MPEDYWHTHKPFIIRRRSTLNAGDNEDGIGKYADEEYDEVRKIRIELEKNQGVFGAVSKFFTGGSKVPVSGAKPTAVEDVVAPAPSAPAVPAPASSQATPLVTPLVAVIDTPVAVPDAAPTATAAPVKSSLFSFLDPTIEAMSIPFTASPRTPTDTAPKSISIAVPVPVVETKTALPVSTPPVVSVPASVPINVSIALPTPAAKPVTNVSVPVAVSPTVTNSNPLTYTIAIPAIEQSIVKTLPNDPNSMSSEELDVIRYNASILARKQRVEELKQLVEMAENDAEKVKIKADLKAFLQTPPPTLAPRPK